MSWSLQCPLNFSFFLLCLYYSFDSLSIYTSMLGILLTSNVRQTVDLKMCKVDSAKNDIVNRHSKHFNNLFSYILWLIFTWELSFIIWSAISYRYFLYVYHQHTVPFAYFILFYHFTIIKTWILDVAARLEVLRNHHLVTVVPMVTLTRGGSTSCGPSDEQIVNL